MSEQDYKELKPGDFVLIRYGTGHLASCLRRLIGKSGNILWFVKIRASWTKSPYAFYSKWNALRWMEIA